MKKLLFLLIPIFALIFLVSCTNELSDEYNTPEKLLSYAIIRDDYNNTTITSSYDTFSVEIEDDGEIKNKILECDELNSVKLISPNTTRYFIYHIHMHHSTSGPVYLELTLYDDGNMKLLYHPALGPSKMGYYTCNSKKAANTCAYVENLVKEKRSNYYSYNEMPI